jgi:hypothetical protein
MGSPALAQRGAPLGPTLALVVAFAVACFCIVLAAAVLVVQPGPQLLPLGEAHAQTLESALYVVGFAVILPLALMVVPPLADRIAAGPNAGGLSVLAGFLAATLATSIVVVERAFGGGVDAMVAVAGAWAFGAMAVLARATRPSPWGALLRWAGTARVMTVLAGALVFVALLSFASPVPDNGRVLGVGLLVAGAVLVGQARWGAPRLPQPWRTGMDVLLVILLLLAVTDVVILEPEYAPVVTFHHNLYLGAANQVLAGDPVLVGTASQYGVGSTYLLAGWFQLAPIGYGTLGFLDAALFALYIAAGYALLRVAGVSVVLAAVASVLVVVTVAYGHPWPLGVFPQWGPLRFGLPIALILAATVETRSGGRSRGAWVTQLVVLGLSSVWALEAFGYTLATFAGIVCFQACTRAAPGRLAWLLRRGAVALAAVVAAQVAFFVATLAFSGEPPDYGWYLAFVEYFLVGGQSEVTFDFTPWSPGLPLAVAYAASAAALVLLARRRRDVVEREPAALIALAGTTAYGIALFSYFVDRSLPYQLFTVALPAVLVGALWFSLLLRESPAESRFARLGALAFALSLAALLVSVAWGFAGTRFEQSALAHFPPGGNSLTGALDRLWHPPPFDPKAPQAEALLDRYMPDQRRVLIFLPPNQQTEVLMRSERANELPFGDPQSDSWIGSRRFPAVADAVAKLRPGERLITEASGLEALGGSPAEPVANTIDTPSEIRPDLLAPLQISALRLITERFDLRVIHRDDQGFVVAALEPRRAPAT